MNRTIASILFVSLSIMGCAGTAATSPGPVTTSSARAIDGRSYEVTLEFPGEAPMKDTLSFVGGKFESTACTGFGFPRWTEYSAETDRDPAAFQVVTHHPNGNTVEWQGTLTSDGIQGTAKRTMQGVTLVGTFRGSARP